MESSESQKSAVMSFRKGWKNAPWIPISKMQAQSFRERPLKGPIVVSNVTIPSPAETEGEFLRSKLWDLFKSMSEGTETLDPPAPCSTYHGEWIGVRKDVQDPRAPQQPNLTEQEKFNLIQNHRQNDLTLFYISGGAWFRAGPPGARPLIQQLCAQTGARAFTFQYRLVPQYTFPTVLLDSLIAYLYLVSPPPGSFHKPVDPKKLILVGESGGGILHLDILQFIQAFSSVADGTPGLSSKKIRFFGRDISLQMPAGCAIVCPGADLALSMPSVKKFEKIDWLSEAAPWVQPNFPADSIWPSNPPRGDLHCDNSAICHPLIDTSTRTDWRGMPPMWIACGEETYSDGIKFLVKNIRDSNVPVTFVEYEYMPHVWNVIIPALPQSKHVTKLWAEACKRIGTLGVSEQRSEVWYVKLGNLDMVKKRFEDLVSFSNEEVLRKMRAARDELATFIWKGPETVENSKL